jgi:pimeloyl-ACP methyl ester carboxylesterase/DNA-binding SARP family transcriptional activator
VPFDNLPVRFAPARGARLAWQQWGDGPATIVAIPPLAQNIEVGWEQPLIRRMLERFGSFSRYLHFDKRGSGASDRHSEVAGIDERVEDLRAVMDDAGIERATFFVQSDGGPMALLFAATYPRRVDRLIMFGSGSCLAPEVPEDIRIERRERQVTEWGTPDSRMVDFFAPSLAADQDFRTWHQRYERLAASAQSLRDLLDLSSELDASEVLDDLRIPTLVIHRTGDRVVPVEKGRQLAARIPNARLLELPGEDHFAYVGDLEEWMPTVEEFVTGEVASAPPPAPDPGVRIVTLGGFGVEVGSDSVAISEWGSRHARQLCKRLVAARGWPVTREELIDLLWPDETDMRKLGARLSVRLSEIRRVLGGGIVADRHIVRLDLDEVSTDLEDFHRARDDRAILAAYTGEFLPEDRYEDWTQPTRDEARTRFITAARRLATTEREAGNPLRAAEYGRRILPVDPYDGDAHRLVVESLLAAGEQGEARRAHTAWASAMKELGLSEPEMPES